MWDNNVEMVEKAIVKWLNINYDKDKMTPWFLCLFSYGLRKTTGGTAHSRGCREWSRWLFCGNPFTSIFTLLVSQQCTIFGFGAHVVLGSG